MLIDFNNMKEMIAEYMNGGDGVAISDGREEKLSAGVCHYCPDGHKHSIVNTGKENLVLYTVVQNVVTE